MDIQIKSYGISYVIYMKFLNFIIYLLWLTIFYYCLGSSNLRSSARSQISSTAKPMLTTTRITTTRKVKFLKIKSKVDEAL